ncbi:hypothetical protein BLA29_015091 [Euroglyphus maynei]|uniref:Uncharacterized protein n=1 Tax=Euroglyphus maynei TaxID=6958 RepID=A0A1Y3AXD8_EURMA|nr:hypothetical protein BLA29_015091 [Euroglyphus maynei]
MSIQVIVNQVLIRNKNNITSRHFKPVVKVRHHKKHNYHMDRLKKNIPMLSYSFYYVSFVCHRILMLHLAVV